VPPVARCRVANPEAAAGGSERAKSVTDHSSVVELAGATRDAPQTRRMDRVDRRNAKIRANHGDVVRRVRVATWINARGDVPRDQISATGNVDVREDPRIGHAEEPRVGCEDDVEIVCQVLATVVKAVRGGDDEPARSEKGRTKRAVWLALIVGAGDSAYVRELIGVVGRAAADGRVHDGGVLWSCERAICGTGWRGRQDTDREQSSQSHGDASRYTSLGHRIPLARLLRFGALAESASRDEDHGSPVLCAADRAAVSDFGPAAAVWQGEHDRAGIQLAQARDLALPERTAGPLRRCAVHLGAGALRRHRAERSR
jgi:hypothetical protein